MEEDSQVPLLLGRPFLATGAALIDMQKGILMLRVGEETADFNLIRSLRNLDIERDDIKSVEDVCINNSNFYYDCNDQLSINEKEMNLQYLEGFDSDSLHNNLHSTEKVMNLEQNGIKQRKKIEEKEFHQGTSEEGLVLKELPSHLKYAYLELPKNKPVIISARISDAEEQRLLEILRKHKESIAWSIEDLKGISPSICIQNTVRRKCKTNC